MLKVTIAIDTDFLQQKLLKRGLHLSLVLRLRVRLGKHLDNFKNPTNIICFEDFKLKAHREVAAVKHQAWS